METSFTGRWIAQHLLPQLKLSANITWLDCDEVYKCARLNLPLDYLSPNDPRKTAIALRPFPAANQTRARTGQGRPDLVERVIWHIHPECLDINQAITLCRRNNLYDALIYVYTRAMRDYVSPVVELLGLIRRVQQYRRHRAEASPTSSSFAEESAIEPIIMNAYKIYPYIADTLTGLTYPSDKPLPDNEAFQAKNDVYKFLFFGRPSVWPVGDGGKLVLTSDEENGVEPTYPYARLLLRFDPEAFFHTLDLAFEDAYLNDETGSVSRLVVVNILREILSSPDLPGAETTFVQIFIARNVPKYPQFIQIPPSALQNILVGLAEDPDTSTREDRQLAAEYLLSTYTPRDSERLLSLFKHAGFYRILRSWHQQERQWPQLMLTYLEDPDLPEDTMFASINDVLRNAKRQNKGSLPTTLAHQLVDSLPSLMSSSVATTAALVDLHMPSSHETALDALEENAVEARFCYLDHLLGPPAEQEEADTSFLALKTRPSPNVPPHLRQTYVTMLCEIDPSRVIRSLKYLPPGFLDAPKTVQTCEHHDVFDAVVWLLDRDNDTEAASSKAESFNQQLSMQIADDIGEPSDESRDSISGSLRKLEAVSETITSVCLRRSQATESSTIPPEDMWFQLLSSQIDCVQRVAGCCSLAALGNSRDDASEDPGVHVERDTISSLRTLVHTTFAALMSVSRAVSFPRLFKRLVSSASQGPASKGTLYTEFRTILTGMLESFRSEGDMLIITKHLVDRDVFDTIVDLSRERAKGWALSRGICTGCGVAFLDGKRTAERA